ncbi:hypothetical protein [Chelatococcus reniformis]|uniref:Uncharacterized protein n=1 Tax=Chelatococcus reniformis TaxID=1494448 RepID=A0A916XM71_9HYPH|nr:hypothetical protein [Chelatococcus reniformis]GGC81932.1 hypothetical protein GCM10010994_44840 [Chelatococcus reniformis]
MRASRTSRGPRPVADLSRRAYPTRLRASEVILGSAALLVLLTLGLRLLAGSAG